MKTNGYDDHMTWYYINYWGNSGEPILYEMFLRFPDISGINVAIDNANDESSDRDIQDILIAMGPK